ncbi:MAG: ATP-binding cassette domain-containing protein [Pirellulaceae bacterium]
MSLISVQNVGIRFRGPELLDDVSCQIEAKQRIGLLGRNGAGKSTFLKLLQGVIRPDNGKVTYGPHVTLSMLPQDVPQDVVSSVFELTLQGVPFDAHDPASQWEAEHNAEQILSRMQLDKDARFETLSSGMKRRVLLAQSLAAKPDVLLLDEPTNHLDIDAITWLEDFLLNWPATLIFVTHDRTFLRRLANRILEIDRGHLFDWSCDYETFLKRKEDALAAEEKQNALFDKKLAQEEVWIRTGIKARRTRNEGRVRALKKMRDERRERREKVGSVRLQIQQAQRSGNLVADLEDVSFHYENRPIVDQFSTLITRGDKVGIIGPNGAGKTTLLKIILGQLAPQTGTVRLGTNQQVAYFDQLRQQLDDEQTVQQNVGDGYDYVTVGDQKRHILGYLQDFLFSPERSRSPVKFLSGGERNRILLAKLFAKPANIIVLDEPTNDLDAETIELLESRLVEFTGTVLLVSHDRTFLNNVVTSSIVFEEGGVKEYDGGYDDWLRQRSVTENSSATNKTAAKPKQASSPDPAAKPDKPRKLKYKEQQELKQLPIEIETLETEIAALHDKMASPEFYQKPGEEIATAQSQLKTLEEKLAVTFARWEELESLT